MSAILALVSAHPILAGLLLGLLGYILATTLTAEKRKDPAEGEMIQPKVKANVNSIRYTREDVSKHNSENDLWVIIDDKVYDLSSFAPSHPGGTAILRNAGGDATRGFYGVQHPKRAFTELRDYQIGVLTEKCQYFATQEEALQQNKSFVFIQNKVYNVESFIDSHPGGVTALQKFLGKDATDAFNGPQHKSQMQTVKQQSHLLFVGYIGDRNEILKDQDKRDFSMDNLKKYSMDELSQHTHESDCWIAIFGKIYNVTKFLDAHPGGRRILLQVAGKDASKQFEESNHPDHVMEEMFPQYIIGELKK